MKKLFKAVLLFCLLGIIVVGCNQSTDVVEHQLEKSSTISKVNFVDSSGNRLDSIFFDISKKLKRDITQKEKEAITLVDNFVNEQNLINKASNKLKTENSTIRYRISPINKEQNYLAVNSIDELTSNLQKYLPITILNKKTSVPGVLALAPGEGSSGEGTLYALQTFENKLGYCGEVYLFTRYWYKNNKQTGILPNRGARNIYFPYQCAVDDIHISSNGDQVVTHSVHYEFVYTLGIDGVAIDIKTLIGTISDYFGIPQTN